MLIADTPLKSETWSLDVLAKSVLPDGRSMRMLAKTLSSCCQVSTYQAVYRGERSNRMP